MRFSGRAPGKHAVTFVFMTVFLDMVGFGLIMPVLPKLIEIVAGTDLAGASILAGWLFLAYGGMQFLFGPLIGNLSDALGRRPVLLLSVAGLFVDYMLMALAPTMVWLFIGRILLACAARPIPPPTPIWQTSPHPMTAPRPSARWGRPSGWASSSARLLAGCLVHSARAYRSSWRRALPR